MAICIDGKKIADARIANMRAFVAERHITPTMVAMTVAPNAPTQQFLKIKNRVAGEIGISMRIESLPGESTEEVVFRTLANAISSSDGVVVQLPYPSQFDVDRILSRIPTDVDPDCMGAHAGDLLRAHAHTVVPPVVSAIRLLCAEYGVALTGKKVAVVGQGRLVGAPASLWFEEEGAEVVRLTKQSGDLALSVSDADIIVLGAGSPGILTPHMITEGVVIFDAGASEEEGKVVGDADPLCAEKASLITPVPGGIGPIAVAELFGNLLRLRYNYGTTE